MRQTRNAIQREINQLTSYNILLLNHCIFSLLRKRLQNVTKRAYLIRKVFEYVKECMQKEGLTIPKGLDGLFQKELPFILEVAVTLMYLDNQILDNKYNVDNNQKVNDNLLGANLLKEALFDYIDQKLEPTIAYQVTRWVRKMLKYVDIGQWLDKNKNNHQAYQNKVNYTFAIGKEVDAFINLQPIESIIEDIQEEIPNKVDFIKFYFQRINLSTATPYILATKLVLELTNYQGKERMSLLDFSYSYGMMVQVVNDNIDFVKTNPTQTKKMEDVLSDLRNKTITLPLLYHLHFNKSGKGLIEEYLRTDNQELLGKRYNEILKEIVLSKAISKSMEISRNLADKAKNHLDKSNSQYQWLDDMCNIAYNNRFYYDLYKAIKVIRRKKKYETL